MSSDPTLIECYERDITFLKQNMLPLENSGKQVEKLDYEGSKDMKLTDDNIQSLAGALMDNDKFCGKVNLEWNGLSDLAILSISEVLRKPGFQNIEKLCLEGNTALTHKSGEYIGQALLDNCDNTKLKELDFEGICLGERGLLRIIDAAN